MFTSDNGGLPGGGNPYVGNVPPSPVLSSNLPLRGHKAQLYEGGTRVVAFANWPGKLSPRKVTAPLHVVDWVPTLTGLASYRPKPELKWDGRDAWPLLSGAVEKPEPRTIYVAHRSGHTIHRDGWKLIALANGKRELYHLSTDPYEKTDLAEREPSHLKELEALLAQERKGDIDVVPEDLRGIRE